MQRLHNCEKPESGLFSGRKQSSSGPKLFIISDLSEADASMSLSTGSYQEFLNKAVKVCVESGFSDYGWSMGPPVRLIRPRRTLLVNSL